MSKVNFENLYFDVTKFGGSTKIQDAYPELLPYKEVSKVSTEEWKVAILVTDVGSDFVKIKDPIQKIDEIFKTLGLDKKNKKNASIHKDFISQKNSNVITACTFLIEYHNNHEFAAWYGLNKLYYEVRRVIDEPLDPKSTNYDKDLDRKTKLQNSADGMLEKLKRYETDLFGSAAMKADAAYKSKRQMKTNWNEKYAQDNQVE